MIPIPRSFLLRFGLSGLVSSSLVLGGWTMPTTVRAAETIPSATSEIRAQASDEAEIRQLTAQWFATWSPGRGSVDWDAMGELFVQEPGELLVFDDAGGSVVVLTSWEDYRATWEPFMAQFTEWQIEPEGEVQVMVDGDLATVVFTLTGGGVDQEGNAVEFRQRATHIWRRIDGRWFIVHEHLTTDS